MQEQAIHDKMCAELGFTYWEQRLNHICKREKIISFETGEWGCEGGICVVDKGVFIKYLLGYCSYMSQELSKKERSMCSENKPFQCIMIINENVKQGLYSLRVQ